MHFELATLCSLRQWRKFPSLGWFVHLKRVNALLPESVSGICAEARKQRPAFLNHPGYGLAVVACGHQSTESSSSQPQR